MDAIARTNLKIEVDRRARHRLRHAGRLSSRGPERIATRIRAQCEGVSVASGNRCRNRVSADRFYCAYHQDQPVV